ncbi:MAG TPA: M67 family metallopeptidase [Candidatus Angelobacter sp.]|nr:M67 family metallopeptidase [Candidatus Angelobacter sp.]
MLLARRVSTMLRISQVNYDLIREQAEQSYPQECCGILLGSPAEGFRSVASIYPCDNVHPEPTRRYSLDPLQVIAAQRVARGRGQDIVGFYHSHPDHPAQYSETDLAQAYWLDCSYVITGVEQGRACHTRSFVLIGPEDSKIFAEEDIEIVESV